MKTVVLGAFHREADKGEGLTSKEAIFAEVRDTLAGLFELDATQIRWDSHLTQDLDLDSIDAIDMAARLQQMTGRRVPEDQLKAVRTVGDVVELVLRQADAPAEAPTGPSSSVPS